MSVNLLFDEVHILIQVCVGMPMRINVYLCMGVCYSCRPSNWHKAGSVCPLGCWNVHFGQQAASVLLNRSCPSYCTSHTMSFSFSVCLSLWVILSLWPYTDSVFAERSNKSNSDWSCAVYHSPHMLHHQLNVSESTLSFHYAFGSRWV